MRSATQSRSVRSTRWSAPCRATWRRLSSRCCGGSLGIVAGATGGGVSTKRRRPVSASTIVMVPTSGNSSSRGSITSMARTSWCEAKPRNALGHGPSSRKSETTGHEAASFRQPLRAAERCSQIRRSGVAIDAMELGEQRHQVRAAGARPHPFGRLAAGDEPADAIAAPRDEEADCGCRGESRVPLLLACRPERHRPAHVDHQRGFELSVGDRVPHVRFERARRHVPVDASHVVARLVDPSFAVRRSRGREAVPDSHLGGSRRAGAGRSAPGRASAAWRRVSIMASRASSVVADGSEIGSAAQMPGSPCDTSTRAVHLGSPDVGRPGRRGSTMLARGAAGVTISLAERSHPSRRPADPARVVGRRATASPAPSRTRPVAVSGVDLVGTGAPQWVAA